MQHKPLLLTLAALTLGTAASAQKVRRDTAARRIPIQTPDARQGALQFRGVSPAALKVPQYGRVELTADFSATYDNPFDLSDVELDARFTAPSGKAMKVPGFLYRPYTRSLKDGREVLTPAGEPSWRVRYTPTEAGEYQVTLFARDRSGTAKMPGPKLTVTPAKAPGFVRVSRRDPRYFEFENGQPYFPIGANTAWGGERGTYDFDDWLAAYAKAGANYGRLWLSPQWTTFALERAGKAEQGLGMEQFDLANAWRIDHVLEAAGERGLYLMLCIDSYNILRAKDGHPQWEQSPHNAKNGGPLERPEEFWTDPHMAAIYRDKLRYLVARYGWSPHVFAWEFWNEADLTTGYAAEPVRKWHEEMTAELRRLDPYGHLIGTSFARAEGEKGIDTLSGLDFVQTHHYGSPDLVRTLADAQAKKAAYGKPHFVGEVGADAGGPRAADDPEGLQIHDPLWISLVTGGSGAAQPWWWDSYIHPRNLYGLFTPVAQFTEGIDWPAEGFRPIQPRLEAGSGLEAWALVGKKTALAWARVEGRAWGRVAAGKEVVPAAPPSTLTVPGLEPGRWRAELWDTWSGKVLSRREVRVPASGEARVALPQVEKDLAVRLKRAGKQDER